VPGTVDSWYHEKESAWLYRLVAAAEDQANRWQQLDPRLTTDFSPALRARVVARLLRHIQPRLLRPILTVMKLRGLSVYSSPAPCPWPKAMLANPEHALEVPAREELGLNPDDLGSPIRAALWSFFSFAVGAALPLLPFFAGLHAAIYVAAAVTVCAVFGMGVILSLFTGHNGLRGGLRLVLIGGGAGLAAWGVGKLPGAGFA